MQYVTSFAMGHLMNRLAFDLDGCFFNFTSAYADLLIKVSGKDLLPEGWRTDPNFPAEWYWERSAGYSPEVEKEVWDKYILKGSKFWKDLEPMPYATEVAAFLNDLWKQGKEIYFISHRMGNKAKKQTEESLYYLGIDYPCVLLEGNKAPLLRLLKPNFYIDDKPSTVKDISVTAQREQWQDFNLFLKTAPYNKNEDCWATGYPQSIVPSVKVGLQLAGIWA